MVCLNSGVNISSFFIFKVNVLTALLNISLASFLPSDLADPLMMRSAIASTFAASLQLCKSGELEMRQDNTFGPIYLRSPAGAEEDGEAQTPPRDAKDGGDLGSME